MAISLQLCLRADGTSQEMMTQSRTQKVGSPANFTKRQAEVLECVARRLTLKETATQLGISESAVNGHIKAIKLQSGVNSLSELAQVWRNFNDLEFDQSYRISPCGKSRLANDEHFRSVDGQDEHGQLLTFAEPMAYHQATPWEEMKSEFVPGVLRGAHAKWNRAAAILLVALGLLALTMLALGVGQGLNAALSALPAAPPTHI